MPRKSPTRRPKAPNPPEADIFAGRITGVFGLRGGLKLAATRSGNSLRDQALVSIDRAGQRSTHRIAGTRRHQKYVLLELENVEDASAAARFVGGMVYAQRDQIVVEPGEYFDADLIGCELHTEQGDRLGRVDAVEHMPASDMLVVRGKFVPLIAEFIVELAPQEKRIVVRIPAGLLDDEGVEA